MRRLTREATCRMILLLLIAAAVGGCQSGPDYGTVNGEVTLDNRAVKEGAIQFFPVDGNLPTAGAVITDGKFTARVPVGKMRVEIRAVKLVQKKGKEEDASPPQDATELIPPIYNVNSRLSIDVVEGVQEVRYDLDSK